METKVIPTRVTTWFVLCSVVAMLYFAREFLVPIALAVFVAFVLAPVVRLLERARLPRVAATIVTMLAVGLLAVGIGLVLVNQLRGFAEDLPGYRSNVRSKAADVREAFSEPLQQATSSVRELGHDLTHAEPLASGRAAGAPATEAVPVTADRTFPALQEVLGSLAALTVIGGLVLLLAFVMLLRWEDLRDRMLALAGENDLESTSRAAKEASVKIGLYLRRQLLVNAIHGTTLGLMLWWIGVPSPVVWGLLGATLRFVPYLGPIVSTGAPILVSFASSEGWSQTWVTAGALLSLEVLSNNLLEPWIYGAATGVSPFALLVSTAFWTWIWGPIGLVLATPLTVCLLVVGKRFSSMRFLDVLFREEPALSRRAQLYHRLLANDQDGAWETLRHEVAGSSFLEAVDRTLLPALGLAGIARGDGRIDIEAREHIGTLAQGLVDELDELPLARATIPLPLRILCFPARDSFDAVGGRLLASELTRRGHTVASSTADRLLAENLELVRRGEVDVVVISSVVPTHFLHLRSICKRLLALETQTEIVVGLWAEELSVEEACARLPLSPRIHVYTSFAQAVAWIEQSAPRRATERLPRAATA